MKIKGVIKNYDWGGKEFLPSLFHCYDGRRQAEYWMGTHPSGEAVCENGELLSSYAGKLPFLFKVLSIASPLSLQCHPTKSQAVEGWEREKTLRENGGEYNYKDDNEKAEVLSAITPVTALCGFRSLGGIKKSLSSAIPVSYGRYYEKLESIKDIFLSSFGFPREVKDEILSELSSSVTSSDARSMDGEFVTEYGIIRETLEKYPGDIGSVFPLMMNVMHIRPYEAVYLEPDTLHAYIRGNGVELMTASDNVLRGGLTSKRVDIPELERIMSFDSIYARSVGSTWSKNGALWYTLPTDDFSLGSIREEEAELVLPHDSIILAMGLSDVGGVKLERGECCFVRGSEEKLKIKTWSTLYIATGGRA